MSTNKYAQFISRQQRQLSVSGTNAPVGTLAEALDPVGKEDKDVNNDGKVNKTDKYLKHRRDVIGAKIKNEEVEELDELSSDLVKRARHNALVKAYDYDNDTPSGTAASKIYKGQAKKFDKYARNKEAQERDAKTKASLPMSKQRKIANEENLDEVSSDLAKRARHEAGVKAYDYDNGTPSGEAASKIYNKQAIKFDKYARDKEAQERDAKTRASLPMSKQRKIATEEVISEEETAYLEEMVGKGKLPDIMSHHYTAMKHHEKMAKHHEGMAAASEHVGDARGADHHYDELMDHANQAEHHKVRYDMAASLGSKMRARKDRDAALSKLKDANEKLDKAKEAKRYGY